MQSSSFWSRAFLSVLACLGTGTQIAAAADSTKPALSISWKSITIRDIEKEEKKANESSKQGPIDFELNGGKLKYRLGGLRVEGNAIIMDTAQVDLNYEEIKGKNVLIVDIPEVTVRMVRKEKDVFGKKIVYDEPVTETKTRRERKETVLFAFKNPGIIAEKKKDFPWSLPLPKTLKIEISADEKTGTNRVQILESKEIIAQLQKAIDESFSDKILGDVLTYRLVNVPKEIEGVLRLKIDGEKATFFNNLRTALKQEVEKPTFIQNLQG